MWRRGFLAFLARSMLRGSGWWATLNVARELAQRTGSQLSMFPATLTHRGE